MNNKHVKFLMYAGGMFLTVLSILAIATTIFVSKGNKSYDDKTISVSGVGEVDSAPDIAYFSFTVKETAKTADEGQKVVSEKISKILDGLDDAGIEEKDIKTQSYTIYPKYEWLKEKPGALLEVEELLYYPNDKKQRVQVGFDISQNISVKVRDFDKVSEILTLIAENRVENLNGPNFQIDDREALEEEARDLAIKDAKAKAKRLAGDLDVRLGKVVSFNENGAGYYPTFAQNSRAVSLEGLDMADKAYAPSLPIGENTISSRVNITYIIK